MEEQRQKANGGRRRRRRSKNDSKPKGQAMPVLIAARRPDSPRLMKVSNRSIAASAQPKRKSADRPAESQTQEQDTRPSTEDKPRRVARIAQASVAVLDEQQARRERLLERLVTCEGRSAISRIADELFRDAGVPAQQQYQIQLLEHVDEAKADAALDALYRLFQSELPIKRPILDQRLRRLEDEADEKSVREKAAALRRFVRSVPQIKPARAS